MKLDMYNSTCNCVFFRLFVHYYVNNQKSNGEQGVRERQVLTQTLECLSCTITIISQQYTTDMVKFLEELDIGWYNDNSFHCQYKCMGESFPEWSGGL